MTQLRSGFSRISQHILFLLGSAFLLVALLMTGLLLSLFAGARPLSAHSALSAQSDAAQSDAACTVQDDSTSTSPLRINEIVAINDGTLTDPADDKTDEDWIELYNPSVETIDLKGLYLSDRLGELTKHQITQSLTIEPFGFLVLFVDDDSEQGADHLAFKLKNSGEAIALTESDGLTIIDSCIFTAQQENVPVGRLPDGGEWGYLSTSTPGGPNAFVPVISGVRNTPEIPSELQLTSVSANITDDISVNSVTLHYSTTNNSTQITTELSSVSMTFQGGNRYESLIAGQANDSLVSYYIEATDNAGGTIRSPVNAPTATHKYLVGYEPPSIAINEIMAANLTSLMDPDEPMTATVSNLFPDWIELYNYGSTIVDLNGLFLTDDRYQPTKNPITTTTLIAPGQALIFYADEDRRQGGQHLNFRLSSTVGETVALYGPYGASPIDLVDFGPMAVDEVYGRFPDGTGPLQDDLCLSPGEKNLLCDTLTYIPFVVFVDRFQ